jgi:hypothetical protein
MSLPRLQRARDAAISYQTNPANLEHNWYPFWNIVAMRIASRISQQDCYVAPQYPLWFSWAKGRPGIDPEDIFQVSSDIDSDDDENNDLEGGPLDFVETDDEAAIKKDPTWTPPFQKSVDVDEEPVRFTRSQVMNNHGDDGRRDDAQNEVGVFGEGLSPKPSTADRSIDSIISVAATIVGNSRKRITDFALIVWQSVPFGIKHETDVVKFDVDHQEDGVGDFITLDQEIILPVPTRDNELNMRIRERVAILIEIKRHPSRKAMENHEIASAKRKNLAAKAKSDVVIQVCRLVSLDSSWESAKPFNLTRKYL